MPKDKTPQKEQIKVTDKRIFTPEGDIREEFRKDIKPSEPQFTRSEEQPVERPAEKPTARPQPSQQPQPAQRPQAQQPPRAEAGPPPGGERRRTIADKAQNPGTAFSDFIEPLLAQAFMSLGLLRNAYSAKPQVDPNAARQMIEILSMLKDKTNGNLTPEEEEFLSTHLGELKLAFVQVTKTI